MSQHPAEPASRPSYPGKPSPSRVREINDALQALFADLHLFEAEMMATDPIGPLPKDADAAELAAWTAVGNVLLNLDEMLMRR